MATDILKVYVGRNFKLEGKQEISVYSDYMNKPGVILDARGNFLANDINVNSWDWFYNYLEFQHFAATKNPDAKPIYMLDLGFVPVVYMPTCFLDLGPKLMQIMDAKQIPYVRMTPTSFALKYVDIMTIDAWVSKMQVAESLGVTPDKVTSEMILRRLILNE